MSTESVIEEVAAERRRQMEREGWTPEHDDGHEWGQLAIAAGWYALNAPFVGQPDCIWDPSIANHEAHELFAGEYTAMRWPWDLQWWKPKNARRDLIRAAALIVAEIERLDRAAAKTPPSGSVDE